MAAGGGASRAALGGVWTVREESSLGMTCVTIVIPSTVVMDVEAMAGSEVTAAQREFWENEKHKQ